jgi:hypothetical protein
MAQCAHCKTETYLYAGGVPICIKCSDLWEATRKPPTATQDIRGTLLQDVLELTARTEEAIREFEAVIGHIPSGLPHPDGTQTIKNASNKLFIARKELMKAHTRLDELFRSVESPEDLKRSG